MKHTNLKMFKKDEKEGAFHWRDININNDLTSLESKMLVRFANSLWYYYDTFSKYNFIFTHRVDLICPKLQHVKF